MMESTLKSATYVTHGLKIATSCDNEPLLSKLAQHLPPGSVRLVNGGLADADFSLHIEKSREDQAESPTAEHYTIFRDREKLFESSNLEALCTVFESALGIYVAENALDRVFVHAGCVSVNNEMILIPGRSFTGKTNLVASFLRHGAQYYSDEFACLDEHGFVHPYPRPLSLRTEMSAERARLSADSLGACIAAEPIAVTYVLVTNYRSGACWKPRELTKGEVLMALLDNTVAARKDPAKTLSVLAAAAQGAQGLAGERGEADDLVSSIVSGSLL
jgi:hypothetical protein